MATSDLKSLTSAIRRNWRGEPSDKAKRYIGKFFNATRLETKITAQVVGNHGTYTVSIQLKDKTITSACSCYIGKSGYCHHCAALATTFLNNPTAFREIKPPQREQIHNLADLHDYLKSITLETLIKELRAKGITQTALAESIGMSSRHLGAIKSSELNNRFHNELGATKLACLWVLEHLSKT